MDCVGEAHTQLVTIFISRLIVQNSIEHIHKITTCFKTCCGMGRTTIDENKNDDEMKSDKSDQNSETIHIGMYKANSFKFDTDRQIMSELERAPY